jgi:hypothetical protein
MKLDQQHRFKSRFHNIELVATEFDEPQPGNTLWRFNLFIEGQLVENQYISYKWTGLYPDLTGYEMDAENGNYIYVPLNGTTLVYDCFTKKFKSVSSNLEKSTNSFVSNTFSEGRLLVVFNREIQVIELSTFTVQNILFAKNRYHLLNALFIDNNLIVKYKDLTDYQIKEKKYDSATMDFER